MNEEKLLDKIKQSANSCEVPESLRPENITDKLVNIEEQKPQKTGKRMYQIGGMVAATLALVIGISAMSRNFGNMNSAEMAEPTEVASEGSESFSSIFKVAGSYDEVGQTMEEYEIALNTKEEFAEEEAVSEEAAQSYHSDSTTAEMLPTDESETLASSEYDSGGNTSDYSKTNLQVEGVDESDVVKTDGEYIYIVSANHEVRIIKIDGGDIKEVSTVTVEAGDEEEVIEIYLANSRLNIITEGQEGGISETEKDTYAIDYRTTTTIYTYDLNNPEMPKALGKVSQDGDYNTSRKVGDYIYLFTNFYPEYTGIQARQRINEENGFVDMVPYVNEEVIEPADIYLPIQPETCSYMVISSINTNDPTKIIDKKAILEEAGTFYVTAKNMYVRKEYWNHNGESTSIAKFSFNDGKIKGESVGVVPGRITDTFAINEYGETLRVLTTVLGYSKLDNQVTVFNDKMKVIGKIDGLAEGETIYSARFMGETGYFVTYRNVDPLFAVDFSNPEEPQILSELKITGFSEYLHFYGKDKLLGIGWETDPETGWQEGLKLSMFDISDPRDVREIDKTVIGNVESFPGEYDYKALTISPEKNIIGLMVFSTASDAYKGNYMIFSYDEEKGFENQLVYDFVPRSPDYYEHKKARGLYVGDTFYIATEYEIFAFNMKGDYEKIGELLSQE